MNNGLVADSNGSVVMVSGTLVEDADASDRATLPLFVTKPITLAEGDFTISADAVPAEGAIGLASYDPQDPLGFGEIAIAVAGSRAVRVIAKPTAHLLGTYIGFIVPVGYGDSPTPAGTTVGIVTYPVLTMR